MLPLAGNTVLGWTDKDAVDFLHRRRPSSTKHQVRFGRRTVTVEYRRRHVGPADPRNQWGRAGLSVGGPPQPHVGEATEANQLGKHPQVTPTPRIREERNLRTGFHDPVPLADVLDVVEIARDVDPQTDDRGRSEITDHHPDEVRRLGARVVPFVRVLDVAIDEVALCSVTTTTTKVRLARTSRPCRDRPTVDPRAELVVVRRRYRQKTFHSVVSLDGELRGIITTRSRR